MRDVECLIRKRQARVRTAEQTEALDEETLSGQFGAAAQAIWSVQLFLEVLERALSLQRFEDVNRILRRATVQVEERIVRGDPIDGPQLAKLADGAARASMALADPTWGLWVAQVYRRVPLVMPEQVVERLGELVARFPMDMAEPVEQLAAHSRTLQVAPEEAGALAALERVRSSVPADRPRREADFELSFGGRNQLSRHFN